MRRLLRRLAWLIARLLLVVALSFFVVAKATQTRSTNRPDFSTDRLEEPWLPLFFNTHPADLESRLNVIVEHLSRSQSESDVRELKRLGGASIPLLVPRLSGLPAEVRYRVASALVPVAQRMAWRGADEVKSETQAYAYLVEAWKERSVDFQPTIVARWVARLATRGGSALTTSVIEYDTYALPALMAALPQITSPIDVERARHLLSVARRTTGLSWTIPPRASPEEACHVVDHWQRWWQLHAVEYTVARGPSRWSAMLKQTQFGQWTSLVFRFRFGTTRDNRSISHEIISAGLSSLVLLFAGAIGAIAVAATKSHRSRSSRSASRIPFIAFVLTSIPHVAAVAMFSQVGLGHSMLTAGVVACISMALIELGNINRISTADHHTVVPSADSWACKGAGNRQISYWLFAGHTWPFLLTLVFVIEKAFGVQGIGVSCIAAFRRRDLHMLMAITAMTTLWLLVVEFAVQLHRPSRRHGVPMERSP